MVYTTGAYPSMPAAGAHCYPTGVAVPPYANYPIGSHHPPPVYPAAHGTYPAAHGTYPSSVPMGGYGPPPVNPAYPSPYPQPAMNPSGMKCFFALLGSLSILKDPIIYNLETKWVDAKIQVSVSIHWNLYIRLYIWKPY